MVGVTGLPKGGKMGRKEGSPGSELWGRYLGAGKSWARVCVPLRIVFTSGLEPHPFHLSSCSAAGPAHRLVTPRFVFFPFVWVTWALSVVGE